MGLYSGGWMLVMYRLLDHFVDADPSSCNPAEFECEASTRYGTIYSFTYLRGGIDRGDLTGTWTTPGRSATNSVLLWPDAMAYFVSAIARTTPEMLAAPAR